MTTENKDNNVVEEKKPTTKKRASKKTKATITKELKTLAKDIDVEITSTVKGDIIYKSKRNDLDNIYIEGLDSTDTVSLALLLEIAKKPKNLLSNLDIVLVDIYTDEYKLSDVIDLLKLTDLYVFDDMSGSSLDSFITETDASEFEKKFKAIKETAVKDKLVERSVYLFQEGQLDSNFKRTVFEEYSNNEYLYKIV